MGATAADFADQEMQSVAQAMRDAVDKPANEASSPVLRGVSRFAYTSAYVVSYGVVYAAVFVAHSLPQENPVMHGFRDGAEAAADALKSE